jgi:flagellar basal-body rod modification protein FlgD
MSSVQSSYSTGVPQVNTLATVTESKSVLDKDGFLKLFVAQLTHQDPNNPMSTSESMNQMASFSMVEQVTNMAAENAKIAQLLTTQSAVGLIGRTVTYLDAEKVPQTGVVERVSTDKGATTLTIGGTAGIDPKSITEVA